MSKIADYIIARLEQLESENAELANENDRFGKDVQTHEQAYRAALESISKLKAEISELKHRFETQQVA